MYSDFSWLGAPLSSGSVPIMGGALRAPAHHQNIWKIVVVKPRSGYLPKGVVYLLLVFGLPHVASCSGILTAPSTAPSAV